MLQSGEAVAKVRHFNRFYTREIGVLEASLLNSGFSLTEARILFELSVSENGTASDLIARLGLDPGYMSRIVKSFIARRLVTREVDPRDRRRTALRLTRKGEQAFVELDRRSAEATSTLLTRISAARLPNVLKSMSTIEQALAQERPDQAFILRPLRVGDIGWVIHRQGLLYEREYGWNQEYEALVAKILAEFVMKFDGSREACWIAECQGEIAGSVFLVSENETTARLRLLYVEAAMRGKGLGRALVEACTVFARQMGYSTIVLWTQSILTGARAIYEKQGYRLIKSEAHTSFGHDLMGETWELDLGRHRD
jgi:DNA-binding MarR family transcriptional regulator/N-acetylglutamate synthase-like GNAT family acetyltransferase